MRTTISGDGVLTLSAESDLESFALRKWVESSTFGYEESEKLNRTLLKIDSSKIIIDTNNLNENPTRSNPRN